MKFGSIIIAISLAIGGYFLFNRDGGSTETNLPTNYTPAPSQNVIIENSKQVIKITAKGGYQPRKSIAEAGVPTILRFDTNGTYDCSIVVTVPSLKIRKSLPPTGITDIDLGTPKKGLLKGTCGMGMYNFEIDFRDS